MRAEFRRYAAAARRRLAGRGQGALNGDGCMVCGAPRSAYEETAFASKPHLVRSMSRCSGCGYVSIAELSQDRYRGKTSMEQLPDADRIGTEDKPGREFLMARMGLDILRCDGIEVLVYGIGRSLDNVHIGKLHRVTNVAIADIMKLRDDAEFHDANQPATKTFPVVIASEVVEHFRDPHPDFAKLFQFVAKDGILICGTNVYNGGDLTKDRYPFYPDHTSYYTPEALLEMATRHGFHVDFRSPKLAGDKGRKRYVIFARSARVMQNVALYFGYTAVAPSE